jgi:hypothetical protein
MTRCSFGKAVADYFLPVKLGLRFLVFLLLLSLFALTIVASPRLSMCRGSA